MSTDVASVPAVELRDVRKNFGPTEIIRGVNLAIPRGERHAIIGPNGAGKTTLFNLISGRFPISSGSITVNGQSTRSEEHTLNSSHIQKSRMPSSA